MRRPSVARLRLFLVGAVAYGVFALMEWWQLRRGPILVEEGSLNGAGPESAGSVDALEREPAEP